MGTTMTAERALSLREKAQERFEQLENQMKTGESDPEAWEMARRTVEFYGRQAEILKTKEAEEAERQAQLRRASEARANRKRILETYSTQAGALADARDAHRKAVLTLAAALIEYDRATSHAVAGVDAKALDEFAPLQPDPRNVKFHKEQFVRSVFVEDYEEAIRQGLLSNSNQWMVKKLTAEHGYTDTTHVRKLADKLEKGSDQ